MTQPIIEMGVWTSSRPSCCVTDIPKNFNTISPEVTGSPAQRVDQPNGPDRWKSGSAASAKVRFVAAVKYARKEVGGKVESNSERSCIF